jgi:hypothetical protein
MLPVCPWVALDLQTAVKAGRRRHCLDPIRRTLSHQFTPKWFDAPSLLVASQGRSSGDKACLQAAEQQVLAWQVLQFSGSGSQLLID